MNAVVGESMCLVTLLFQFLVLYSANVVYIGIVISSRFSTLPWYYTINSTRVHRALVIFSTCDCNDIIFEMKLLVCSKKTIICDFCNIINVIGIYLIVLVQCLSDY